MGQTNHRINNVIVNAINEGIEEYETGYEWYESWDACDTCGSLGDVRVYETQSCGFFWTRDGEGRHYGAVGHEQGQLCPECMLGRAAELEALNERIKEAADTDVAAGAPCADYRFYYLA